MIIVSIIFSLGQYIASKLVKLMLDHQVELIVIMGIAEGLFILTILLGVLLLKSKKPKKAKLLIELPDQVHESQANLTAEEDSIPLTKIESFWQITKLSFISIYESAKIFLVPRDGHRRLFLYLCFLANFLDQFVFGEEKGLIGTYTKLAPFKWTAIQYASYKAWRPIAQILGMTFGLVVFKMLFKFRDTLIIVFAITSMGLCVLWIGLATASWMIYASLAPGSLHGLLNPLTYTFMSCIVEPDEIGKAFAISSIAQKLAGFAQTAVLQNIYIATVDWYQVRMENETAACMIKDE
ncbi:hypothetical protein WR25_14543 isoform B [Diploscapter pachys]|uniref:Battenin n=1 Tax=Diploscapter pachys TaxID=2018661 RepID=A0A2A2L4U1_9BILA|nr:hypothetical protein WR25_14543 isoform B [Diploscapter pachys]